MEEMNGCEEVLESHVTADGVLRLVVCKPIGEEDLLIGLVGFAWHTHGDILCELSGLDEAIAVREFVGRIISDQVPIVLTYTDGILTDAVPTDDPEAYLSGYARYGKPNEKVSLRYWSGKTDSPSNPARA